MCKNPNIHVGIKRLDFTHRGRIAARLTDGREVSVPLAFFPDIKALPASKRDEWMILDDQFFTFKRMGKVYSIEDLMRLS